MIANPGGYTIDGGGGGFGINFFSPPPARRVPATPPTVYTVPVTPGPYVDPRPYIETTGPAYTPPPSTPTYTPPPSGTGSVVNPSAAYRAANPWSDLVGQLGNFWTQLPASAPAPPAAISAPPASNAATDTALTSLLGLASAQFAGAGGGAPTGMGPVDPSLLGGGTGLPVSPSPATTSAPATSAPATGPNKMLILVAIIVVAAVGYWYYHKRKAAA